MTAAHPTRGEIDHALRLQDAENRAIPGTEDEARAVTSRIYGDWQAAREQGRDIPDLLSFLRDVADNTSVTNEDRGSTRAFWSYESQPEGAPEVVRHKFLAQACGASRGYQVLEDTPAGRQLDSYYLGEEIVRETLAEDYELERKDTKEAAKYVWKTVSERYAEAATGPIVAFAADITEGSVLGANELPILLDHEKVGKEGVRFPLPMPRHEHLPPEIDSLIAEPPIRAQIRMEDFSPKESPKAFAEKLGAIDVPEANREAHSAALWQLSLHSSYEELGASQAENQVSQQKTSAFAYKLTTRPLARPAAPRGPTGHGVYDPAAAPPPPVPTPRHAGVER